MSRSLSLAIKLKYLTPITGRSTNTLSFHTNSQRPKSLPLFEMRGNTLLMKQKFWLLKMRHSSSIVTLQNEIMIKEVYSTTWYDLPPVYRKMFHILFSQIQQPIHFFAIQVYPVNMVTFARSVNFVYTVINLLRQRNARFWNSTFVAPLGALFTYYIDFKFQLICKVWFSKQQTHGF